MLPEIFSYAFMQKGLIVGSAIAIICSLMGTFLVLKRYSLFGDALSHMAFGGISLGLFSGIYPLWTAYAVSILGALGMTKLRKSTKISGDAAIAVLLVSGFGIGILLISATGGFSVDLFSFLFGSILLISNEDTILILAGLTIMVVAWYWIYFRILETGRSVPASMEQVQWENISEQDSTTNPGSETSKK